MAEVRLLGLEPRAYGLKVPASTDEEQATTTSGRTLSEIADLLPSDGAQRKAKLLGFPYDGLPSIDDRLANILHNWPHFSDAKKNALEALARAPMK